LWLDVLSATGACTPHAVTALRKEADELTRILVASRETALAKRRRQSIKRKINQQSKIKDQKW
jgi:hypothetical protein